MLALPTTGTGFAVRDEVGGLLSLSVDGVISVGSVGICR
jgi:hypothetical protein